jgi:ribosomal-protein-alanine N-acetyltransferase
MNRPTILDGGPDDLEEMMVTMEEAFDPSFGEAWTRPQCLGLLGLPGVWLSLARAEGEPAGFALNRIIFDEAELLLIGVRPRFRQRGIGRALVEWSIGRAASLGAKRFHLEVRAGNPAHQLYEALGFEQIGRRPAYYRGANGQLFDALTLARSV